MIHSLTPIQKHMVEEKTSHYIKLANELLSLQLERIDVRFDLSGRSSGMFVLKYGQMSIRYNEIIFSRYFDDALVNTVAHEVAHYVVCSVWGLKKVKPHGAEWKQVMQLFNVPAEVTSRYDVDGLPLKQQRRHQYACGCMTHQLTTTRHNKVQKKSAIYNCRKCHQPLKYQSIS